jgi:hypothetical protein
MYFQSPTAGLATAPAAAVMGSGSLALAMALAAPGLCLQHCVFVGESVKGQEQHCATLQTLFVVKGAGPQWKKANTRTYGDCCVHVASAARAVKLLKFCRDDVQVAH